MRYSHCDRSSLHFGIFKTHCRVLERFWWPKLHGHVEALISTCQLCQKTKTSGKLHGQMGIRSWRSGIISTTDAAIWSEKITDVWISTQANGLTEHSNSTIKSYLRKYLNSKRSKQPDWDLWLRELCYAYNTSIHSSTGYSPAELMFSGRKFLIPLDNLYGSTHASHYSFESFKAELQLMYDTARSQMGLRQAKAATYLEKKMINTALQRDDSVLIFDPRSKQGLRLEGPLTSC